MIKTLRQAIMLSALTFATLVVTAQNTGNKNATQKVEEKSLGERIIDKSTKVLEKAGNAISGVIEKYSGMMQVSPNALSNVILYQFIDEWYGTRYQLGGNSTKGIDCSALVQRLYKNVYSMDLLRTSLLQFRNAEYVADKNKLKEGDLVFFRIHGGPVSHVGVYLQNNYFVHASSSKGVMISNLNDTYWTRYYVGGGKIKN
jgi:cell wall-associated NlpC family hydrolase